MFSTMVEPAAQGEVGSVIRELLGSVGFQARPTKTARVKREFTLTIPSRAVMWMLVVMVIENDLS